MARYDNYSDEERDRHDRRDFSDREDRFQRERPWNYNEPFPDRARAGDYRSERFGRGRFGERASYEYDEPRYSGSNRYSGGLREDLYDRERGPGREYYPTRRREFGPAKSRLRCRDIMTRDLAVATRDTTLREIAIMMKDEDTGVIPVVEYDINRAGDGSEQAKEARAAGTRYSYGKLVGLITDRDIVMRAVAEDRDWARTRAEEIMSTDILTARPDDRVVDVIRKMADKQVRRIPAVSENGYLRGMISMGDIALETEADMELGEALEEISKKSSFWSRIFS
jgi:CBS domain-containing protein